MLDFRECTYTEQVPTNFPAIIAADIGGTNSNFGIFKRTRDEYQLVLSIHFKSQEITDFTAVVKQLLNYLKERYNITAQEGIFAVAGVIGPDRLKSKPTNLSFTIDATQIIEGTSLTSASLVNDFEIIGYGVDKIAAKDLITINEGRVFKHANKAVIGAGTGFGKCILDWNKYAGRYIALASEGGHADLAAQSMLDLELVQFIKKTENFTCNVSWEDVLSGNGIKRLYRFFRYHNDKNNNNIALMDEGPHPDEIFSARNNNEYSKRTCMLYTQLYARCAKNFALDALALNGIYIAGGIAARNVELFKDPLFMKEFINCGKMQNTLKDIPIFVIADYNVSLYGALEYMKLEKLCV